MTEHVEHVEIYVEAARRGGHRWWRYLLGIVIILFSWLLVGGIASALVAFAVGGREGLTALAEADLAALGPVGGFLAVVSAYPFLLAGILLTVALIHRRHPRTLVTARDAVSWRRVAEGFVALFVPMCLVVGLGQYLFYPDTFSFTSDLALFALFVPLALLLTPIQSTSEELLFRGYLVQGASVIWTNRVFLALTSATLFTLPHMLNPEAQAGGWLTVFLNYFVSGGLVLVVVSLIDGTTELAIGAHLANNIFNALVVSATGGVFTTPALFSTGEYHATFYALSVLVVVPLFLATLYWVFKREPRQPEPAAPDAAESD